ncbi:MAG: PQQ-binding-like beta-propeller repeat protein [Chloroflexi bacterium]|nr:PQQ-binding-like beta-propeller repeat protein [Chloroflexota bacterium]
MASTSAGATPPPSANQRICPRCGREVLATSIRCRFCMADLRDDRPQPRYGRSTPERRRWFPQIRHRWSRRRGFAVIFLALVLFYGGRWAWVHHISAGQPLPLPASDAVGMAEVPAATWPSANGGRNQARVTGASPRLDGEVAWEVTLPNVVMRTPVADEERMYIVYLDSFGAYSLDDGSEVWRISRPGMLSPPTVVGGRLYMALRTGQVTALDSATGEYVWTARLDEELFTSPIVFRGILYVYAPGRLYGIDANNGDVLWSIDVEGNWGEAAPVVDEGHVAVAARKAVVVFDRETGGRTFRHPHTSITGLIFGEDFIYSVSPAFAAGIDPESTLPWWEGTRLYWNWLWAFGAAPEPPRPEVEWVSRVRPSDLRAGTAFTLVFRPAFDGERIIASDTTGLVRTYHGTTGVLDWEADLEAIHGAPTVTPDGLLVPRQESLALLDLQTGELIAERPLERLRTRVKRWAVVVERGTFVVDEPGTILALR